MKEFEVYTCLTCDHYIISSNPEDWEKYHQTDNSCPKCGSDMCGCPYCREITLKNL